MRETFCCRGLYNREQRYKYISRNDTALKRKRLKYDAIPPLRPNIFRHLSTVSKERPTRCPTGESRTKKAEEEERLRREKEIELDTFSCVREMDEKWNKKLSPRVFLINQGTQFYCILKDGDSRVLYCLKIFESLRFEIWLIGNKINPKYCNVHGAEITPCSMIKSILEYLEKNCGAQNQPEGKRESLID